MILMIILFGAIFNIAMGCIHMVEGYIGWMLIHFFLGLFCLYCYGVNLS